MFAMEFYSAINNEIISFSGKCMELDIMLTEISQSYKDKYHMFFLICAIWGEEHESKRGTIRDAEGGGEEEREDKEGNRRDENDQRALNACVGMS
jgi:hypothetical protein